MDPLSQGLLGAALPQSFAKRKTIRKAAICGFLGGMAPDLDILIRSSIDPLLAIEYHRHFTHSLIFIPFGGFIVSYLLWLLFFRKNSSFSSIYLFTTLGFATHALLDACTSYGTRLLWPFSDIRVAWNIVSIIDPIFTFTLLIFCVLSLYRKSRFLMRIGLCISLSYLALGWFKHNMVSETIYEVAKKRGHTVERILLNPTIGNNFLWRSVYQSDGQYYIDAVYASFFNKPIIHEGMKVQVIDKNTIFPELKPDSMQRNDIKRFSYFSQDFIYLYPYRENVIADLRYGTLPYDDKSLWGIQVNPKQPDSHVTFGNFRNISDKHYEQFWLMLKGKFPEDN